MIDNPHFNAFVFILTAASSAACSEQQLALEVEAPVSDAIPTPRAEDRFVRFPVFASERALEPPPAVEANILFGIITGAFDGTIEEFAFDSGSARIRLDVEQDGTGQLIFGEGVPPAPPSSASEPFPAASYPPGPRDEVPVFDGIIEGFSYPIRLIAKDSPGGRMLHFQANSFDIFADWCGLQSEFHADSGTCAPRGYARPAGDGVSCDIYELDDDGQLIAREPCFEFDICMNRCACSADACTAWQVMDIDIFVLPGSTHPATGGTIPEFDALISLTWPGLTLEAHLEARWTPVEIVSP